MALSGRLEPGRMLQGLPRQSSAGSSARPHGSAPGQSFMKRASSRPNEHFAANAAPRASETVMSCASPVGALHLPSAGRWPGLCRAIDRRSPKSCGSW